MKGKMKPKQKYRVTRMTQVMLFFLENHLPSLQTHGTYKGQPINEWTNDCSLNEEVEPYVKVQLNDLRIKYLSKLLLSYINLLHDNVMSQLEEFEKIDISEREKLKKSVEKRIIERIKKYC
ncbi:hypothetical protein R6Q57_006381 [Mikania cordata]